MKKALNFCSTEGLVSVIKFANIGGMEYTEYAPKEGDDKVRRKLMFITKMAPASSNLILIDFEPEEVEPLELPGTVSQVPTDEFDKMYEAIIGYIDAEPGKWTTLNPNKNEQTLRLDLIIQIKGILKMNYDILEASLLYVTDLGFSVKLEDVPAGEGFALIESWMNEIEEEEKLIFPSYFHRATMSFHRKERPKGIFEGLAAMMKEFKEMDAAGELDDDDETGNGSIPTHKLN